MLVKEQENKYITKKRHRHHKLEQVAENAKPQNKNNNLHLTLSECFHKCPSKSHKGHEEKKQTNRKQKLYVIILIRKEEEKNEKERIKKMKKRRNNYCYNHIASSSRILMNYSAD